MWVSDGYGMRNAGLIKNILNLEIRVEFLTGEWSSGKEVAAEPGKRGRKLRSGFANPTTLRKRM